MSDAELLLDILIPQYEDPRILRAIASIVDHPEAERFRILVLDGGGDRDLHAAIAHRLRRKDIHRVAPDRGIYDALNHGLQLATAPWIGWLGSDDMLSQSFSSRYIAEADPETMFLSFTTLFFREVDGAVVRVYRPVRSRLLRKHGFHLPHFSTFIRTEVARQFRFDIEQRNFADQLYMHALEAAYRGSVIDEVSTLMCAGGASNKSYATILTANAGVRRAIATRLGPVRSHAYVALKLVYKLLQTVQARLHPITIHAYCRHLRENNLRLVD